MKRTIHILIDFHELKEVVKLGNRIMDYLESQSQKEIDSLTSRVLNVADKLKTTIEKEQNGTTSN